MSDNILAFPRSSGPQGEPPQEGMNLRDHFAAKAMAAYVAVTWREGVADVDDKRIASWSYQMADAMLAERAKAKAGADHV